MGLKRAEIRECAHYGEGQQPGPTKRPDKPEITNMTYLIRLLALTLTVSISAGLIADENLTIKPHAFEAPDGTTVEAEWGEMKVPLFHDRPEEGSITVSFLRFPATTDNPGAPLVYMAGGPGGVGSNFAAGHRYSRL